MSAALLAVIEAVWALPHKAMAAPDRPSGLTAECSHEDSLEQLQEAKREEPIHKHGGRGTMRSRYQFDTGVDTGRKDTALMRAEPRWPGRLRLRLLAAVLIAAFAALTIYAYTANVSVVSAASPCPAVNDWCTTMTVADAEGDGLLHGYEFDKFGSIVDDTIQPGGANINVWTVHTFAHPHPQLPDYIFFGSNPRVPRGTQVTIEGHTFIADAESHDGEEGDTGDKWEFPSGELPASLVWSAGQEVTVSVKLASPCDNLDNLVNAIVVKDLTGEITQAGDTNLHKIRLDPYKSYLIEAIGVEGSDMLGVKEYTNPTLEDPEIPAIWNARGRSELITYGSKSDGDGNAIRRILRTDHRTYKIEVSSGNNGTGTYQLKVRVNNICRINDDGDVQYQWAGGPEGYPAGSDLPAGTGGRQVLLAGTDWGNNNVTRPEIHHVLGDNWDSNPDEDWFGVDLEQGEEYTVRLRTKTSLPERLQATQLKILGIKDADGNAISGTASAGDAGKKVFVEDWEAPSTGRYYIAVGTEGTDRTGIYWISITRKN